MAAAKDFEKVVLNRLDATARLPQQLQQLYKEIDVLTGLAASEPQVKHSLPRPYRYQVLATHGILDEQVPYIQEPALVLSQVVSPASQEEDPTPGFLTLTEVMNLKLNTELVALTACSTGVGKQVTGEGVMGLGRAFQYAGARGVLMSLWSVDEASTVWLVERLFGYLQQGKNTLEALRQARAEVRQAGYEHPFFWAPFILVGER
jgi:CHAT domain-containing protein